MEAELVGVKAGKEELEKQLRTEKEERARVQENLASAVPKYRYDELQQEQVKLTKSESEAVGARVPIRWNP